MTHQRIALPTKLHLPPLRANLVRRVGLTDLINDAHDAKLVIVSAPAGFGKTTLLATVADESDQIAWLSLDNRDNDPSRFWLNVVQAIRSVEPGIGTEAIEVFGSIHPQHLQDGVLSLCKDMATLKCEGIRGVVLDDYHVIESVTIHNTLETLIGNMPPGWQLLITTRSSPPLSLPTLRARAQVCEIGPDQLRFSAQETHQFFEQIEKIDLSDDILAAVSDRTEGWAVALQLLAISLRGTDDQNAFIRQFAGDNRLIVDYFNAEVLARQSEPVQHFLMVSAIPERFCVPLVQFMMEELPQLQAEDAYSMLEYVEHANLFLTPQDQKRQWYRYHHLFHDLLRDRVRCDFGEQLPALRQKAATWLEQNLYYDDAVRLLLQMEDYPGCERVIWSAAQQYFPEGQFFLLREWLRQLPTTVLGNSPKMVFLASLIAFNSGQPREAKKWLSLLVQLTTQGPDAIQNDPVLAAELRAFSLFAEAWVETTRNNSAAVRVITPQVGKIIEQLPNQLPGQWPGTAARLNLIYGELLFQCGDLIQARRAFSQGIEACRNWGYGIFAGSLYTRMAATHRVAGELRQMNQVAEEGISFIDTTPAAGRLEATGYLQQFIGESHMERYQLDRAFEILHEIYNRSKRIEHYLLQVIAGLSLTAVMRCRGQADDAAELSDEIFRVAAHHEINTWYINGPGPTRARMFLECDDIDSAAEWASANSLLPDDEFDYLREFDYLALSRVLIARQDYDHATELLSRIRSQSESAGRNRVAIEAMILAASVLHAKNDKVAALSQLADALKMAGRQNYIRMFLDEGPGLIELLRIFRDSNPDNAFVNKVLGFAPSARDHIKRVTLLGSDVLSKREVEVLQLISDGCSNRDVATKLCLSPHTVKAHTRNIYDKLTVSSRTQAVAKAFSLGLIRQRH